LGERKRPRANENEEEPRKRNGLLLQFLTLKRKTSENKGTWRTDPMGDDLKKNLNNAREAALSAKEGTIAPTGSERYSRRKNESQVRPYEGLGGLKLGGDVW